MKNTKRIISLALACLMLALSALCFASCGEAKGPFVYVTVADENGEIVARYEKVEFTDGMTVDSALSALHAEKCEGGYASAESAYGLSMTKLWGVENGGSYGYYVNNASPASLADTLKEGDHIYAFVYKVGSNKRYFHSIFHIFVLLGSICHSLSVIFYAL